MESKHAQMSSSTIDFIGYTYWSINSQVQTAYEKFIGVIPEDVKTASIIFIAHKDAWITCFIENQHRRLKCVGLGGK